MRKDVLTSNQIELLPLIAEFSRDYYLAGGTAIALHLGHRRSIDFDLFTPVEIKRQTVKRTLGRHAYPVSGVLFEDSEQLHIVVNSVKLTFFSYPHSIPTPEHLDQIIKMPDLLTLSAMKAYALGGRAKWKDYVDLYFLLRDHFTLKQVSAKAMELFGQYYNEKLFREQICYFEDIDYSEKVDFVGDVALDENIKRFLSDVATTSFT